MIDRFLIAVLIIYMIESECVASVDECRITRVLEEEMGMS